MKAIFLLGTLKRKRSGGDFSHTEVLCELVIEDLKNYAVRSEIVRLIEYDIKPGVKSNMGKGDDWPAILKKVVAADIVVFATPIWWGLHSSLIQRVIERMDDLNEELLETGKSKLANKVGGIVVTGEEDGAQHIVGNISNFLIWNGVTLPPGCAVTFLDEYKRATKNSLRKKLRDDHPTAAASETMARNLAFFARLLQENDIPRHEKGAG